MGSTSRPERPAGGRFDGLREAARTASVPAWVASVLLAAEALVLLALGVLQVLRGFGSDIDDVGRAETGGVLAILGAAGVAVLAAGVLRRGASYRSPTLVVQILCLPVAWGLLQAGDYGYGIPLLVVPLVIVVALLASGGFGPSAPDARGPATPVGRDEDGDAGRSDGRRVPRGPRRP
ncbi:hypothetical protein [Frankia sp. QA3]|uniref:hypothetical protein n=1 Tax=Frankia sp. QA3 TaxID=710111 RepID=UPI000269CE8E|nr:hypothetical protein [Frankia sp. QA3]EIV95778.1 hypothetical protein FraQA3DRAFT_5623 [Frankia sp. QA3]